MARRLALAAAPLCLLALAAQADDDTRHADAHEHGHGTLGIAIEGNTVTMALEVPAADIIGFEHEPSTPEEEAAMDQGKAKLAKPLALFALSPAAGCTVSEAHVRIGAHEHDEDHDDNEHDNKHDDDEHEETHADVDAEYTLTCDNAAAIDRIDFPYFAAFPNAEELDVQVISEAGQFAGEVTRESPKLDLGN